MENTAYHMLATCTALVYIREKHMAGEMGLSVGNGIKIFVVFIIQPLECFGAGEIPEKNLKKTSCGVMAKQHGGRCFVRFIAQGGLIRLVSWSA